MSDYNNKTAGKTSIDVDAVKKRALGMETIYAERSKLFQRYREIYFMDNVERPKGNEIDDGDWKITASPSGRNEVTGMKRLLDTSEIHIAIKAGGKTVAKSDKIEDGLKTILRVSGEQKPARVERDANLSAVLFGPVCLTAESVDDLISVQKKPIYKKRLERIRQRTPFLISAINAEESYPEWGNYGLLSHTWKYKVKGSELKERWGVGDCKDDVEYIVHDFLDLENRVVWADGIKDTILAEPHKLPSMNIVVRYAGGSSIFFKPEEQLQSFLYAKAKGEWDKRENLFWTYLFTAIYMQGLPGPLLIVDPESAAQNPTFQFDFTGGIRKIVAKATPTNFPVIDNDVLQIKAMMDNVSGESTIRGATLGENISGSTFSAMAMLSSAGKLPMIDSQEAVEQAFTDIFLHILDRIKSEGIENELIPPADIPDHVEVVVSMEAKLPQDNLRNAQVAGMLGDKVSDEWIHTNLLQIGNTKEMHRQIAKEQIVKAMLAKIAQDPQYMDQFIKTALGMPAQPQQPQQPQPGGAGMTPPGGEPGMEGMPPEGIPPEAMQQMMMQQGGMEGAPQTDAMIPPQERS